MELKVQVLGNNEYYSIIVDKNDTVEYLAENIIKNIFKKFPHKHHFFRLGLRKFGSRLFKMLYSGLLKDYKIKKNDIIEIRFDMHTNLGGGIDNLKDESKTQLAKKIGFDLNLIKRDELRINLIHFDKNMANEENYKYFNKFKVDVVGGFYAMDDVNIFKKFLDKISEKNIPFLVVSSGSSGKEIIHICKQYNFIKEVIIFCMNYENNKHYINENPGYVKKVTTSVSELYDYLKQFFGHEQLCQECFPEAPYQFEEWEIRMDQQIEMCPIITKEEYDSCYFLIHKAYAYFFGYFDSKFHSFNSENYRIIENLLDKLYMFGYFTDDEKDKSSLRNIFKALKNTIRSDVFVEETIRKYTGESIFCYLFNRMMRNIEPGIIYLSYFMGPFIFELNKYVKNRKECAFSQNMTLYRKFNCTETEFYSYKLNLNHIICFPALTSTSSKDINFNPSNLAGQINKKDDNSLNVKLIIKYRHENDNISPGIIIEDKKGYNGKYISHYEHEKEVLLFPFTFAKIVSIHSEKKFGKEIQIVNMELINRKTYLEYSYVEPKSSSCIII